MSEEQPSATPPNAQLVALIDALGVVLARSIVVFGLAVVGLAPFFLASIVISKYVTPWISVSLSFYAFFVLSMMCFVEYIQYLVGLKQPNIRFLEGLPMFGQFIVLLFALPILPVIVGYIPFLGMSKKSFLLKMEFDILSIYFTSLVCFASGVYAVSYLPYLSNIFFEPPGLAGLGQAVSYTLDIVLRGLLFDVFEHFKIHISSVAQTENAVGLFTTYVLRFSSSALAVSLIVELTKATSKRMAKLDAGENRS